MRGQVSVCLFHLLIVSSAGEWCNFNHDSNYESYCSNGCCGNGCCYQLDDESPIPLIVGCTVAGLFVVITVAALMYACLRSSTRPGRVISVGGPTSVNALTISSTGGGYSHYGVPVLASQPPPYSLPQPPPYSLYPLTGTVPYSTTCMMQPPGYSELPTPRSPHSLTVGNQAPPISPHTQTVVNQAPPISPHTQTVGNQAPPISPHTQTVGNQAPPISPHTQTVGNQAPPISPHTQTTPNQVSSQNLHIQTTPNQVSSQNHHFQTTPNQVSTQQLHIQSVHSQLPSPHSQMAVS